jgi:uncharacterized protein (DUF4415 family)
LLLAERWSGLPSGRDVPNPASKKLIALRLDPDVIERFRATGPGWQSRINMVLRDYLEKT